MELVGHRCGAAPFAPGTSTSGPSNPPRNWSTPGQAGCPALLGPEAGYREQRRSELDYLEVCTMEDALAALKRLKNDPGCIGHGARTGVPGRSSTPPT